VKRRVCTSALALLLFGACTIERVSVGSPIAGEPAEWLVAGRTTKPEVLARYGPPDLIARQLDGDLFVWRYLRRNTATFTLEEPVITNLMLFEYTRSDEKDDRLTVLFDAQGVVKAFGLRRGTPELGKF
jgi:hypothetical protein